MYGIGVVVLGCLLIACNGKDSRKEETNNDQDVNTFAGFSSRFKTAAFPYQLADTTLLNNKDTGSLSLQYTATVVPDSTVKKIFGKTSGVKYTPLARLGSKGKDSYYILKAHTGNKKAALLVAFDKDGNYGATVPFLVPDNNDATTQWTTIDKSFAVTKTVLQKSETDLALEGKEVLAFDANEKKFTLIMTDMLNDNPAVLVNPLDTFPKTNKFAGDYYVNKKNLIAVRDGRHANQILVYIHTENNSRDCIGELKGEFIITSSTTAVYRLGGDPCVLGLTFSGNTVTMKEESGCGNYRGLDCPFEGSFTRKKEQKPKETNKKTKRTK